jgi:hypothetical protein
LLGTLFPKGSSAREHLLRLVLSHSGARTGGVRSGAASAPVRALQWLSEP